MFCTRLSQKLYVMRKVLILAILLPLFSMLYGQEKITANDIIEPYTGKFRPAVNMGYYYPWTDEQLADLAAGNTNEGIKGIGARAMRPALFEFFLEEHGYDIRVPAFEHYKSLGMKEHTVFVGYPSDEHRETIEYCNGYRSEVFANLYEDIWDDGENGTPVNDKNYYALYLYKMVTKYKEYVKFWEIWNEPDFDHTFSKGWLPETEEGNWWKNNPDPCDYALRAPVFNYIRMLRISYEVIKFVDPEAYVATGGLGYASFIDVILRNTDNPNNGEVSEEYPLAGGAYFDVLSYHSYPHVENLRWWNNDLGGFEYSRNSDTAANGVIQKQEEFRAVLESYGYDGETYPQKEWIITEANTPRKAFGDYMGSEESQINFLMKSLAYCPRNYIHQFHMYNLGESATYDDATSEFQLMGLYEKLENTPYGEQVETNAGFAYKTSSDILYGSRFDPLRTQKLELPDNIKGGAYKDRNGKRFYVLWAETQMDNSELSSATYSFPSYLSIRRLEKTAWDYSKTGVRQKVEPKQIHLTGTPIFLYEDNPPLEFDPEVEVTFAEFKCFPNPFNEQATISFEVDKYSKISLQIYNPQGFLVKNLIKKEYYPKGMHYVDFEEIIPPGIYYLRLKIGQLIYIKKITRIED